jgi:hypothetical protein
MQELSREMANWSRINMVTLCSRMRDEKLRTKRGMKQREGISLIPIFLAFLLVPMQIMHSRSLPPLILVSTLSRVASCLAAQILQRKCSVLNEETNLHFSYLLDDIPLRNAQKLLWQP